MIDIFMSDAPSYQSGMSFSGLLFGSMKEIGQFLTMLILFSATFLLIRRLRKDKVRFMLSMLLPIFQISYVWSVSIQSEFFFSFMFALILTAELKILDLFPLKKEDYFFAFAILLFPARLFNSTSAILGHLWIFWVVFAVCYLVSKLRMGKLQGSHFVCYFVYLILSFSAYMIYIFLSFLMPELAQRLGSYVGGLVCTIFSVMVVLGFAVFLIRIRYRGQLLEFNRFSSKYDHIERYFYWFSVLILTVCTLIFLPFTIMSAQNRLILVFFPCLCITLLCMQMAFVFLLFRVAFYKNSATLSQWEKEGLASYYQNLSTNLTSMQDIRHDIKNIFFTMGGFVNRSDDLEMKEFFWSKIYPYSENTIRQSELFSSIYQLPSETLRAFFHLKLSQMIQCKVDVSFHVNILPEHFSLGMDLIDLTRVLGILLDNAMEEASGTEDGFVDIQINGDERGCSYTIKNSITETTKYQGIHCGRTTKGEGHGNGLLIVKKITAQYKNVVMNSYIQNYTFIQSLNICIFSEKPQQEKNAVSH